MKKFFNYERGFWKVLGRVGDLLMLNIVFLICCIPIVTIGAAKTALYAETKKMAKNEEGYLVSGFLEQFKDNFKASTIIWLLYLGISMLPVVDLIACNIMENSLFVTFCRTVMVFTLMMLNMGLFYALALQSTFENNIKNTIKNAFIMTIGHFPFSIIMLLIDLSPFVAVIFFTQYIAIVVPLLMFLWFATAAYMNSFLLNRIFAKYIKQEVKMS